MNVHSPQRRIFKLQSNIALVVVLIGLAITLGGLFTHARGTSAVAATPGVLTGYAWSNMPDSSDQNKASGGAVGQGGGWISMSCQNASVCSTSNYGVSINGSGDLSGQAWSDALGWISFDQSDVNGCPTGTCRGHVDQTTGAVTGWARALGGTQAQAGGWDGWIHLSGSNYGVTVSGCSWTGYSWGGPVVGWIHWKGTNYGVTGSGTGCNQVAITSFVVTPTAMTGAGNVSITWGSSGSTSCTGDNFPTSGSGHTIAVSGGPVSVPISGNTIFTINCTGPGGTATQNTLVTVTYPSPAVTLVANPKSVKKNSNSQLQWTAQNVQASSCTLTGGGLNQALSNAQNDSGVVTSPRITQTTTFTITCTGLDSTTPTSSATVGVNPVVQEL